MWRAVAGLLGLTLLGLSTSAIAAEVPAATEDSHPPDRQDGEVTTERWKEPETPHTLHWELLRLPEMAVRLLVSPLYPAVALVEDKRIDKRLEHVLTNDAKTSLFLPTLVIINRDGPGLGFSYKHKDVFGGLQRFHAAGVIKQNLDRKFAVEYLNPVPRLDGRMIGGVVEYEIDTNQRYYGIGPDTSVVDDERAIEVDEIAVSTLFGIGGPESDLAAFGSDLSLGYRRIRLAPGNGSGLVPHSRHLLWIVGHTLG